MNTDRRSHEKRSLRSLLTKARCGIVSWAAILLLAVNVLASGALPAQPISLSRILLSRNDAAGLLAFDPEICSGHSPVQQPPSLPGGLGHHEMHCVFCLPLMHGGMVVPAETSTVDKPDETQDRFALATEQQRIIPARFRSFALPRAPPLA